MKSHPRRFLLAVLIPMLATFATPLVAQPSGLVSWWQAESNAVDSADGNNGVLVTSVDRGSAAEKAGLKAGDVITAIGGRNVSSPDGFSREMRGDSKPVLKIIRDKKEREVRVE